MRQAALFPAKAGLPLALVAAFARFWGAYPERKPNPRALAEKEFAKAVKAGAAPDDLVLAAEGYAAEVKRLGTANDFIVHAATFLRQARWRDYLAPPALIGVPAAGGAEPTHELWPAMKPHMDASTFTAWIGRCQAVEMDDGLVLITSHRVVAQRVRDDFLPLLRRAVGKPISIHFQEHSR
jgi:hypothetical protein